MHFGPPYQKEDRVEFVKKNEQTNKDHWNGFHIRTEKFFTLNSRFQGEGLNMMALCRGINGGREDTEQIIPLSVINHKGK